MEFVAGGAEGLEEDFSVGEVGFAFGEGFALGGDEGLGFVITITPAAEEFFRRGAQGVVLGGGEKPAGGGGEFAGWNADAGGGIGLGDRCEEALLPFRAAGEELRRRRPQGRGSFRPEFEDGSAE